MNGVAVRDAARATGETERTVAALWRRAVERDPAFPAFLVQDGEEWRPVGWDEAARRVRLVAAGLLDLGVRHGDRVAILSRTRIEWTLCDYALASIGAVSIPIYQTSSRKECAYLLRDSGARVLVCENAEQLAKTHGLDAELPALERVVAFDDADEGGEAVALDDLAERGRALLERDPDRLADAQARVSSADTLTHIYTSGTTGDPKGCVLSHANFASLTASVARIDELFERGDTVLLFLPLAHNFGRLVQYCGAEIGFTIAYCSEVADLQTAFARVRPTLFPTVPRLFEKAHAAVQANVAQTRGPKRRLARWAFGVGARAAARKADRRGLGPLLALEHRLADRLVLARVRDRFGGRLRLAVSGGAPLARPIIEFFAGCGILVLEGYGLSETTSGCTLNRPHDYHFGTVGRAVPDVELAIAPDGEIMVRGPTIFQGYDGRPDATAEAVTGDGWLLTGDIGTLDGDGFLTITDRKKEIIVTSGGKKIPPQNVENALKASGYVSNALLVGERRPYLVALVAVDRDESAKVAHTEEDVRALVARVIDEVNSHVGPTEQIKRFALLPRDFSADEGEVTPTLKLKRRICEAHFADEIERLYALPRDAAAGASASGGS